MAVNIELYKIFYYVAKNKSFSTAARELYITQPAVSLSISQLEKQLGGKLFHRARKGVELTEYGRAIFDYVERAMSLVDEIEKRFEEIKNLDTGVLRIGASDNICKNYLGRYIVDFNKENPNVRIEIHNGSTNKTIGLIKSGKVDLGFVNYPVLDDEIDAMPCVYLHDCFVVGEQLREYAKGRQKIEDLYKLPLILLEKGTNTRLIFDENMRQLNLKPKPNIEVGSHEVLVMLATMGLGVACVTEEYVKNELEQRKLYKINVNINFRPRRLGYCTLKKYDTNFVVKKFVENIEVLQI